MPHFIDKSSELYNVLYEYNAVEVEGAFSCKQLFTGKGAGSHPTGSAVLSDISALTYNYHYGYKKLKKFLQTNGADADPSKLLDNNFNIKVYVRFSNAKSDASSPPAPARASNIISFGNSSSSLSAFNILTIVCLLL